MRDEQPELPSISPGSPEEIIRENLTRAMIRYKGDVQAYYNELLKNAPEPKNDNPWGCLQRIADARIRALRSN